MANVARARTLKALLLLTLHFFCAAATAQIYRFVDPKTGEVSYTNQPVPGPVRPSTGEAKKERGKATDSQRVEPNNREQAQLSEPTSAYVPIVEGAEATYLLNVRAFPEGMGVAGAWVMTNWSAARTLAREPKRAAPPGWGGNTDPMQEWAAALARSGSYQSALTLYRVRCSARTMYAEEAILYEQKFAQGKVVQQERSGGPGDNVIPGTLNEMLLERICAQMRARRVHGF